MKNLLISGLPRCGKTTLIKKIIDNQSTSDKFGGFITEEIREKGERVGFKIISFPEREEGFLARKGFPSRCHLGSYGVNFEHLEKIGVASIQRALALGKIVVVDEIGKMELFSKKFKYILAQALNSPQKVLATIMERKNEFADKVKGRYDVKLIILNQDNFQNVFYEVQNWLLK
ncbi:MAG: NTPase [Candidatus Aminicenantaceae bacterium]